MKFIQKSGKVEKEIDDLLYKDHAVVENQEYQFDRPIVTLYGVNDCCYDGWDPCPLITLMETHPRSVRKDVHSVEIPVSNITAMTYYRSSAPKYLQPHCMYIRTDYCKFNLMYITDLVMEYIVRIARDNGIIIENLLTE